MGVIKFRCPKGVPTKGNINLFEHCVHSCAERCLPKGLIIQMIEWIESNPHEGDYVSPTTILYCMRKTYYERTEDYATEPTSLYPAFRGEKFHDLFTVPENEIEGFECEKKIKRTFSGPRSGETVIHGRKDVHDHTEGTIEDYKSVAMDQLTRRKKEGATKECIYQLNMYGWLSKWKNVKKLVAHYVGMKEISTTSHLSPIQAWRKDKPTDKLDNLVNTEATGKTRENKTKKGVSIQKEYLMWVKVPEVPILPKEVLAEFMDQRIYLWKRAFAQKEPPPLLDYEEYKWLCGLCEFKPQCDKYEEESEL